MGIEEFTDVFRKSTEYDELDQKFKLVCNKGIQEVLHYITKYGLNNTAITEQQALSKIAERFPAGTDQLVKMLESTEALSKQQQFCAPHSCRSQIWIEGLIAQLENIHSKSINKDFEDGYNGGIRHAIEIVKEHSLPTQPELLEVPKVTGVMIDYFKREGFSLHESLNVHVNVPNTLSLVYKEFREWLTADDYAKKEDIFARAWLDGWAEEKEQLYYVKVGNLVFAGWEDSFIAKFMTTDNIGWTDYAHEISTKDAAVEVARIIGGEAVPVGEEE